MNEQPDTGTTPASPPTTSAVSTRQLIGLTLRYNRNLILAAYCTGLLLAVIIQGVVIVVDHRLNNIIFGVASVFAVSASMFIGITINANEVSERRLRLLLLLPARRRTVGWARFLTPLLIQVAGFLAGLVLLAVQRIAGIESILPRPERALIYIAGLTGFFLYFPMLFPDLALLWRGGRTRLAMAVHVLIAVCFAALGWLQISGGWKIPGMIYFMPLPAVALAAVSLWVFHERPSFAR